MAIHLSSSDVANLRSSLSVVLAPFSYQTGDEWRRAVCTAVEGLVEAHSSAFALPLTSEPLLSGRPETVKALQSILPPPSWMMHALTERRRALGLDVADWLDIYDVPAVKKTPFYNEVVLPNGFLAPIQLSADIPGCPMPAVLALYFDSEQSAGAHAAKRKEMLELLMPAFRAGVRTHRAMKQYRDAMISIGELSHIAIVLFDHSGSPVHESPTFARMIAQDPEGENIRRKAAAAAATLSVLVSSPHIRANSERPLTSDVSTRSGRYTVSAMSLGDMFGSTATVAVLLEASATPAMDPTRLISHYHLTHREVQTAILIQRGLSGREVAATLGVSLNTARRHTEHVISKLGVHSRNAVAALLNGRQSPPE